jgi:uncharacterized membrane protein YdfJ with MMPL/SSD domain
MGRYAPGTAGYAELIVLVQRANGASIVGEELRNFTFALQSLFNNTWNCSGGEACSKLPFVSYFTLVDLNLTEAAKLFVSPQKDATYIMMEMRDYVEKIADYAHFLSPELPKLVAGHFPAGDVTARLTGEPVLDQDVQDCIESDMLLCDGIAFPVALLIFCATLKSIRLLVVPLATITTALLSSFLIMYPIAMVRDVISFAPSLMLSTTIAMSIDYSLFMLSRFREEVFINVPPEIAIATMVASSGHTVLVSGMTLSLCFAGLLLFPMELLSSLGLSCSIAVAVAVVVNLTLTPSLMLTFPNFFANIAKGRRDNYTVSADYVPLMGGGINIDEIPDTAEFTANGRDYTRSWWHKFGRLLLQWRVPVLIVLAGLVVYPTYVGVNFKWTMNALAFAPRNGAATDTFADFEDIFGGGRYGYMLCLVSAQCVFLYSKLSGDYFGIFYR